MYGKCAAANRGISAVALLTDNEGTYRVLATGSGRPPNSTHTSIVNVIQQAAQTAGAALRNGTVYTTETPTEMDLGMARRCGLSRIVSTGSGSMVRFTTSLGAHDGIGRSLGLRDGWSGCMEPWVRRDLNRDGWIAPASFNSYKGDLSRFFGWMRTTRRDDDANAMNRLFFAGDLAPLTFDVPAEGKNLGVSNLGLTDAQKHILFLSVAHDMVHRVWGQRENTDTGRHDISYVGWNIGAILVDAAGDNILAWGINTNKLNTSRHGEVNLIQYYERRLGRLPLPAGAFFYTTLEPCQMCAGMLATIGRTNNLTVIWGQDDDNINASALQRGCLGNNRAGSASKFGAYGWSDTLKFRHGQSTERFRQEAQRSKQEAENALRYQLSRQEYNRRNRQLGDAEKVLRGLERFGSIQTTEFLRQVEAEHHFGQARQRRNLSTTMEELRNVRETIEGFGGTFKPSSIRGMRDLAAIGVNIGQRDFSAHMALSNKLKTFVEKIGTAQARS